MAFGRRPFSSFPESPACAIFLTAVSIVCYKFRAIEHTTRLVVEIVYNPLISNNRAVEISAVRVGNGQDSRELK
jgi:hypothetical protein